MPQEPWHRRRQLTSFSWDDQELNHLFVLFFFGGVHAGTLDIYIENISITVYIIDIN